MLTVLLRAVGHSRIVIIGRIRIVVTIIDPTGPDRDGDRAVKTIAMITELTVGVMHANLITRRDMMIEDLTRVNAIGARFRCMVEIDDGEERMLDRKYYVKVLMLLSQI